MISLNSSILKEGLFIHLMKGVTMKTLKIFSGLTTVSAFIFSFVFLFQSLNFAQQKKFAQKGVWEFGGTMSFSSRKQVPNGNAYGDAVSTISAQPFVGFFITDNFELGFNPFGFSYTSFGGYSFTQVTIFLAPSYNFSTSKENLYPFIEGLIGYTSQSFSSGSSLNGISYGGRAGLKIPVGSSGLLNVGINYILITLNPANSNGRNGENDFAFSAGFTVWL